MDEDDVSMPDEGVPDVRKHNQLIDAISALGGKKNNRLSQRSVITNQISEFNFSASKDKGSKVNLSELVGTLHDTALHKDFHQQIVKIQKKKDVVTVPAPKHEREKIQRKVAYEKTAEDVTKWDPIVQKNRLADQIIFPLEKTDVKILTTDQLVETFKPRTPLEMEVAALLGRSKHVITDKKQELTPAEQKALEAMDVNKAKERRKELMRHRALLSYKQAKSKRQNKIKSKSFHRVMKKDKRRKEEKILAEMEKNDPEGFAEKMKLLDRQRIEERMSLKHRGGSKFGQKQKLYAKYDEKARDEVQTMLQLSRDLTKKQEVDMDDEDSEGGVSLDSEDETNMLESEASLLVGKNPWMTPQRLKAKEKKTVDLSSNAQIERNEEESSSENEMEGLNEGTNDDKDDVISLEKTNKAGTVNVGRETGDIEDIFKNFEPKNHKKSKGKKTHVNLDTLENSKANIGDDEKVEEKINETSKNKKSKTSKDTKKVSKKAIEPVDDDEEEDRTEIGMDEKLNRKRTLDDFSDDSDADVTPQKKVKQSSGKTVKGKTKGKKDVEEAYADPKKLMMVESRIHHTGEGLHVIDDDNDSGDDEDQRMMIAQAFADDDVVEEFIAEKEEDIEKKKVKDIDLTLPGWGDWGGEGVEPTRKKRMRIKAPKQAPRKDRLIGHVIINEDKLKDVVKHQVNSVPFPYTTIQQYEASIRAPIGETWNTPSAFAELTKPKVITKQGAIIAPIDKVQTFKNEKNLKKSKGDHKSKGDNFGKNLGERHTGGNSGQNAGKDRDQKSKKGGKLSKLKKSK